MIEIVRVDIVDAKTLDIELNNGHLILFDTRCLLQEKQMYDCLGDMEVLPRPMTDGQSIFWQDGPHISLAKIFTMLKTQVVF